PIFGVSSVEGAVAHLGIEEPWIVPRRPERHRIRGILVSPHDVGVLIEANAPVLHDGTVRALMATSARVVVDSGYGLAVSERARNACDPVPQDVRALGLVDIVGVERLELVDVRILAPTAAVEAVAHVTRRAPGGTEVAVAVVRSAATQVAVAARERHLLVDEDGERRSRERLVVGPEALIERERAEGVVPEDGVRLLLTEAAVDRELDERLHAARTRLDGIEDGIRHFPEAELGCRVLVDTGVLGKLHVEPDREHRAREDSHLGRERTSRDGFAMRVVAHAAAPPVRYDPQVAGVDELKPV